MHTIAARKTELVAQCVANLRKSKARPATGIHRASTALREDGTESTTKRTSWSFGQATTPACASDWVVGTACMFPNVDDMKKKIRDQMTRPPYSVQECYHETGVAQAIAKHWIFEMLTLVCISVNALWISFECDFNDADTLYSADLVFQVVENFFCFYFVFEWVVRISAFKRKLDALRDWWFRFDTFLALSMVLETWIMTAIIWLTADDMTGVVGNMTVLRVAKLLRLSKMARVARVLRAVPEVMILVKGMVTATRSVCFTLALLTIFLYVFAICLRQLTKDSFIGGLYFPNVPVAMQNLLTYGTFMDSFAEFTNDITEHSPHILPVMYLFVLVSSLTLMNMLVGVLCEVISAVAASEKEVMTLAHVRGRIIEIMGTINFDSEELISRSEFRRLVTDQRVVHLLHDVDVDVVSLVDLEDYLFEEVDDESGFSTGRDLTVHEFMELVLSLRGSNNATVKDIVHMQRSMIKHMSTIAKMVSSTRDSLHRNTSAGDSPQRNDSQHPNQLPASHAASEWRRSCASLGVSAPADNVQSNAASIQSLPHQFHHHSERLMKELLETLASFHDHRRIEIEPQSHKKDHTTPPLRNVASDNGTRGNAAATPIQIAQHPDTTLRDPSSEVGAAVLAPVVGPAGTSRHQLQSGAPTQEATTVPNDSFIDYLHVASPPTSKGEEFVNAMMTLNDAMPAETAKDSRLYPL